MVNEDTIFSAFDFPALGFFILASAAHSMFGAFPDDVQFDFYVGIQGVGKMIWFSSFLDDMYTLDDEETIYEFFNDYLADKTVLDAAKAALDERY